MKALSRLMLAVAASAVALPVFAADSHTKIAPDAATAHMTAAAQQRGKIAKLLSTRGTAQAKAAAEVDAVNPTPLPGPLLPNAFRAYPPSCAADPVPDVVSGPNQSQRVTLFATDGSGNPDNTGVETVTITLWRIACSSSGTERPYNTDGGYNALTFMRIQRDSQYEGDQTFYPTVPFVTSIQGSTTGKLVRLATEPNTVISEAPFDSPVIVSTTYILENYPVDAAGYTYFDYTFQLQVDPVINGVNPAAFTLGDYTPTAQSYPRAFQSMPIDGYMSATWFDAAHNGEGMLTQIIDNGDGATRTFFSAWYTYDPLGLPFWMTIQGTFPYGVTSLTNVPVYYTTGGGFAGDFGSAVDVHNWGTMSVSYPDCLTMVFSFTGQTDAAIQGPAGSGTRTWTRLADTNGLSCE